MACVDIMQFVTVHQRAFELHVVIKWVLGFPMALYQMRQAFGGTPYSLERH